MKTNTLIIIIHDLIIKMRLHILIQRFLTYEWAIWNYNIISNVAWIIQVCKDSYQYVSWFGNQSLLMSANSGLF